QRLFDGRLGGGVRRGAALSSPAMGSGDAAFGTPAGGALARGDGAAVRRPGERRLRELLAGRDSPAVRRAVRQPPGARPHVGLGGRVRLSPGVYHGAVFADAGWVLGGASRMRVDMR